MIGIGTQYYSEGEFEPKRAYPGFCHVWCVTGALSVLNSGEYKEYLAVVDNQKNGYVINFANNSSAHIQPDKPLWKALAEIAKNYSVEVYKLTIDGGYVPWTGGEGSLKHFDAICIGVKKVI